ncbi:hypothetical protein QE363_001507 [Sphingomonas sp. SORGH_AS870]|uniref:hypothetical protein n=1 Tax=Sphingomonas sp. SORGH_AS_0870 TaxID=3041801 RepID=UPI00285E4ABC|nr:hypothetical protein [Sphingomonas sp. SORGH_AS_0870]MDR6145714.1 hypothetical protein [Sphingomonas sp. SORGH_AS_0870]
MIALATLFALQTVSVAPQVTVPQPPPPAAAPSASEPPHDWTTLPTLTLPPAGPDMVRFVRAEVQAGRCPRDRVTEEGQVVLVVPMAVWLNADGSAQSVVPLAIGCPTVEQYSAGVAQRMIRQMPYRPMRQGDRWYRTVITYTWPG